MELYTLLAAVATSTSLHRMMEPIYIIKKLDRLDGAIQTGKIGDPHMKGIDTRAKAYGLGTSVVAVMTGLSYVVFGLFDASKDALVQYVIVISLLGWFVSMASIDKYHVAIERVTQREAKK